MTRPTIADAREIGKRRGLDRVVVLYTDGEKFGYASWGRTRALCLDARRLGDALLDEAGGTYGRRWGRPNTGGETA